MIPTKKQREEHDRLLVELPIIKDRLGRAGLYRTMHQLDHALQAIGYEVAEIRKEKP